MDTPATATYELQKGFWDRKRRLILSPTFIAYDNKDRLSDEPSRIAAGDILDIKHRTQWIVWYRFHVGRVYDISIRYKPDSEIRIRFRSYFGFRSDYLAVYTSIIETFWALYFQKVVDGYLAMFREGPGITVSDVQLLPEGVRFPGQDTVVLWENLGYAEYYDYFALYQSDRAKMNVRRDFYAWGSEILLSLIRTIKKERATDI